MRARGQGRADRLTVHRSFRGLTGLFLLIATLAPAGLGAQMAEADEDSTGPEFTAFVGVLQPISNLTDDPDSFGTSINPDLLFGGELTLWVSNAVGIGVFGAYSPADLEPFSTQFQGAIPEDLGKAAYLAGMVNLTFRILSSGSAGSLEPYFSVGGGVRRLDVDAIAGPQVEDSTDPAGTLALGLRVPMSSSILFRGELRAVGSMFESPDTGESRFQNDVAISIGLSIR